MANELWTYQMNFDKMLQNMMPYTRIIIYQISSRANIAFNVNPLEVHLAFTPEILAEFISDFPCSLSAVVSSEERWSPHGPIYIFLKQFLRVTYVIFSAQEVVKSYAGLGYYGGIVWF